MAKQYQLMIVGTGTAATVVAMRMRAAGWSVAVIDFRPFGGTCVLRGCDPKKVLVGGAAAIDHWRRMAGKGTVGDSPLVWPDLMAFKRSFTDPVPEERERRFADNGIDTYHGRAQFTGPCTLDVDGVALEAEHILLAAGAEPIKLGIPGEEHLITSEQFLALDNLPPRIALVGGGYIAAEFSHIAARSGVAVTVIQRDERMLTLFDPDLVNWLMEKFRMIGIEVHTGTAVEAIEQSGSVYRIRGTTDGQSVVIETDLPIHAAGRAPALEGLNLDAAQIAVENGRLKLNEYLQSASNSAVYAAGDAAQMGPPLTPVASREAQVVAANLLDGNRHKPDYTGVPSVAFTIPPIATVGLSEEEAREKGHRFRVKSEKASDWYTARQAAEPVYGFKVLVDEDTDRVLGAHLVGPHAEDVINIFALAIRHSLTAGQLKATIFAYPTGASDIGYML